MAKILNLKNNRVLRADGEKSLLNKTDDLINITSLIKRLSKDRSNDSPFSVGCLKFDDYNYDYINSIVLISHERMTKMHSQKVQVNVKSNDVILNLETLDKLKTVYGDVNISDFQILGKDRKILLPVNELNEDIENTNFESQMEHHDTNEQEESESDDDRFSTQGFDPEDIQNIQHAQEDDPFADIINLKEEAAIEGKCSKLIFYS
jgi:hypothetical protein